MQRLRKGDDVVVLAGRDRGKQGTILQILKDDHALVDNINVVKRHTKPNPNKGVTGGIVEKEAPIHVSNLALYNPITKKADRVGFKQLEDGRKVRYFKSNNEVVDVH